jgi:hypothetical protein
VALDPLRLGCRQSDRRSRLFRLPDPIKSAILLIISSWFDSRDVGPIPDGAYALLANYTRF